MVIKRPELILSSEITPESMYRNRRQFLVGSGIAAAVAGSALMVRRRAQAATLQSTARRGQYDADETRTPEPDVISYNNFYEFGTRKEEPALASAGFVTKPWTVSVEGLVRRPQRYNLEDLIKGFSLEDRVYRMRCVEAWSMVIPWMGIPLASIIGKLEPLPSAKFVEFTTLHDPKQMVGQRRATLQWPYVEGLRMDEATNPLTLIAIGLYGKALLPQNGAPLRLVVPWKYGFKGIKSIVKIRFVEKQPRGSWEVDQPDEYGFYANVNPQVDHPRWSQSTEARLDGTFASSFVRRPTAMFNGYGSYVAQMYSGMDLRRNF
jgi:methionine sulfoxide reductase catalytic subunit